MTRNSRSRTPRTAIRTWLSTPLGRILIAAGVLFVVAALAVPTIAFVRTMSPSGQSAASQRDLSQAHVGDSITAVVQLGQRNGSGAFAATLLQPQRSNSYQLTSQRLRIELGADLSVAMGNSKSLQPGALVQVTGQLTGPNTITVHHATLLTGFVTVKR